MNGQKRVSSGQPEGGRYAAHQRAEGAVELTTPGSAGDRLAAQRAIAAAENAELARSGGAHAFGGFDKVRVSENGTLRYYRGSKLHNTAGPAVSTIDGDEEWRQDGKLHNPYGPTVYRRGGRVVGWHRQGKSINEPSVADQVDGLIKGIDAGVYDPQWARHRGSQLLGDNGLERFDAVFEASDRSL